MVSDAPARHGPPNRTILLMALDHGAHLRMSTMVIAVTPSPTGFTRTLRASCSCSYTHTLFCSSSDHEFCTSETG